MAPICHDYWFNHVKPLLITNNHHQPAPFNTSNGCHCQVPRNSRFKAPSRTGAQALRRGQLGVSAVVFGTTPCWLMISWGIIRITWGIILKSLLYPYIYIFICIYIFIMIILITLYIWWFPEIGVPCSSSIFLLMDFPWNKPTIFGTSMTMETPILGLIIIQERGIPN